MQKLYGTILLIFLALTLVACGNSEEEAIVVEKEELQPEEVIQVDQDTDDVADEVDVVEKDTTVEQTPTTEPATNLEDVFTNMIKASKEITSFLISGTTESTTTTTGGTHTVDVTELTGEVVLEPFAQHLTLKVVSGDDTDTEIYLKDSAMYIDSPDMDGWITMAHNQEALSFMTGLQEHQLEHLLSYKDAFELTEDADHYIISYIGDDELYKEVMHNEVMGIQSIELDSLLENMEITGSSTMYVDKETYYIVRQQSTTHTKTVLQLEITTVDESDFTLSDHNTVADIIIPTDVIDNAFDITGQMGSPD